MLQREWFAQIVRQPLVYCYCVFYDHTTWDCSKHMATRITLTDGGEMSEKITIVMQTLIQI